MNFRKALFVLATIVALSIVHLSIYTQNINLKYEVEDLKKTLGKLQGDLRYLRSIAAKKKSLKRIENIAVNKLNMVRPDKINYIKSSTEEARP